MAAAQSSLDVLNSMVPPPAKAPAQSVPTATQPQPAQTQPSSMDVLSGLAQGTSAPPQQEQQQPEETDFFSRAYQASGIKGIVDDFKGKFEEAHAKEVANAEMRKQVMEMVKSGDYGTALETLLHHVATGAKKDIASDPAALLGPPGQIAAGSAGHAIKGIKELAKGNIGEGIVEGVTAVPIVGPMARSIAEPGAADIKSGNLEGLAGDVIGGGAQISSLLLGKGKSAEGESGALRPKTVEAAGEKIPVRASTQEGAKAKVAGAVEYGADSGKLKQFDVEKTQPAVRKATSNVAAEAADTSRSATVPAKEDAFGFGKASDELQARSKTVFKRLDELSDREFSEAQEDAANARQDYTAAGRKAYREALDRQESLFTKFQSEFEPGALDKAKAEWKQSQGLDDLRVRFNRSVHPTPVELSKTGEPDIGYVNGKTFRESITDGLQKDQYGKNEFERAGFTPKHVQTIEDLGRIMEKGNNLHRLNPIMKLVAHGGMGAIGLLGHPAEAATILGGEYLIGKVLGNIMTDPEASGILLKGLKSSATAPAIANALRPYMGTKPPEPQAKQP